MTRTANGELRRFVTSEVARDAERLAEAITPRETTSSRLTGCLADRFRDRLAHWPHQAGCEGDQDIAPCMGWGQIARDALAVTHARPSVSKPKGLRKLLDCRDPAIELIDVGASS